MADDTTPVPDPPKTVRVKATQLHTYNGQRYDVGDCYDIEEQYADSVAVQGKAVRDTVPAVAARHTTDVTPQHTSGVQPLNTDDLETPAEQPGRGGKHDPRR